MTRAQSFQRLQSIYWSKLRCPYAGANAHVVRLNRPLLKMWMETDCDEYTFIGTGPFHVPIRMKMVYPSTTLFLPWAHSLAADSPHLIAITDSITGDDDGLLWQLEEQPDFDSLNDGIDLVLRLDGVDTPRTGDFRTSFYFTFGDMAVSTGFDIHMLPDGDPVPDVPGEFHFRDSSFITVDPDDSIQSGFLVSSAGPWPMGAEVHFDRIDTIAYEWWYKDGFNVPTLASWCDPKFVLLPKDGVLTIQDDWELLEEGLKMSPPPPEELMAYGLLQSIPDACLNVTQAPRQPNAPGEGKRSKSIHKLI